MIVNTCTVLRCTEMYCAVLYCDKIAQELEKEVSEAQWRRAAALRRSRPALLAEMAVWEQEAEEVEEAAAAGIVSVGPGDCVDGRNAICCKSKSFWC